MGVGLRKKKLENAGVQAAFLGQRSNSAARAGGAVKILFIKLVTKKIMVRPRVSQKNMMAVGRLFSTCKIQGQ